MNLQKEFKNKTGKNLDLTEMLYSMSDRGVKVT